jgi:uncharacterized protein (TIGR00290 family)
MTSRKTYLNWSSGKDAALALHYLKQDPRYSVEYLLTSVNAHYDRVSMHGLRRELLTAQLAALGLPHGTIEMPEQPTNAIYEQLQGQKARELRAEGFECAAYGDIFLADLRQYREQQLAAWGLEPVFPLWQKNTTEMLAELVGLGFRAVIVCADARRLDGSFAGRIIDQEGLAAFLHDLPAGVDPCGENGEFHTFCFDGPVFRHPVPFSPGELVRREYQNGGEKIGYWFRDLGLHDCMIA